MPLPLLTPRLRLRGPRPDDFEALLAAIWSSPEVMRFIGGQPRPRDVAVERFAWSCELFQRTGMALWTVERRDDGEILGDCGVIPLEGRGPEIELGYRLRPSVWGQGLATEAARAAIGHAMAPREEGGLGLRRLVAVTDLENHASQRVLAKLGLRPLGTADYYGSPHALFETGAVEDADH
jgi:RimJ/RimL family protein N-acetyltransferase